MVEYIIIGLLVLVIILLIVLLVRRQNNNDLMERIGHFEANINKEIGDFKFSFSKDLMTDFEKLNEKIERKLTLISDTVNERLDKNFEKSNKTFMDVFVNYIIFFHLCKPHLSRICYLSALLGNKRLSARFLMVFSSLRSAAFFGAAPTSPNGFFLAIIQYILDFTPGRGGVPGAHGHQGEKPSIFPF